MNPYQALLSSLVPGNVFLHPTIPGVFCQATVGITVGGALTNCYVFCSPAGSGIAVGNVLAITPSTPVTVVNDPTFNL